MGQGLGGWGSRGAVGVFDVSVSGHGGPRCCGLLSCVQNSSSQGCYYSPGCVCRHQAAESI